MQVPADVAQLEKRRRLPAERPLAELGRAPGNAERAVDSLLFEPRPGTVLPLAISAGAAVFPYDGESYETLLATADSRMYRDKTRRKRQGSGASTTPEERVTGRQDFLLAFDRRDWPGATRHHRDARGMERG